MLPRPSPLEIPDRPGKYLRVETEGGELVFRLPNEKRQFQLLQLIAGRVQQGRSGLSVVSSLDVLAAVVGVCWYHPALALEEPLPWQEADLAAREVALTVLEPSEKETAGEDGGFDVEAVQRALEARQDAARWAVLSSYGERVLDELDEEGLGDRNTVGACFAALSQAMGRNFVPQEVIDARLGFSRAGRATGG